MPIIVILDRLSPIPLHKQISDAFVAEISAGRLCAGQQVPSTRELSESLCVSRDTVIRAYDELTAKCVLESSNRSNTRVCRLCAQKVELYVDLIGTESETSFARVSDFGQKLLDSEPAKRRTRRIADNQGEYSALSRQWRSALVSASKNIADADEVSDPFGFLKLRQQAVNLFSKSRGVRADYKNCLILPSYESAFDMVSRTLINPGDTVVLESPVRPSVKRVFELLDANVVEVPVDGQGMVVDVLEKIVSPCKLLVVSPQAHFPTGAVLSQERRVRILSWITKYCDFVIEDASNSDFLFSTAPYPPLQASGVAKQIFHLRTLENAMNSMNSLAFLLIPTPLRELFERVALYAASNCAQIEQIALAQLIEQGLLERHIRRAQIVLRNRRQALIFALRQRFTREFSHFNESGGVFLCVNFDLNVSDEKILAAAGYAGLPLESTRSFYSQPGAFLGKEGEFIIDLARVDSANVFDVVGNFHALLAAQRAVTGVAAKLFDEEFGVAELTDFSAASSS